MTNFEYCGAVHMIYEGQQENALTCIRAIRDRHDGVNRNPFSEPECGHHYARSMASWAAIPAWNQFHYSGVTGEISFTAAPGAYFWSNGYAWGTCRIGKQQAELKVLHGELALKRFGLNDGRSKKMKNLALKKGQTYTVEL